jgi:hypothetical protein
MLIFLTMVLGPGCGFMLYALYQFSREAMRFRHADPRKLRVTVVRTADRLTGGIKENALSPAADRLEGEEPAQGKSVTSYVKNCFAAIPTGTAHAAMKHVAKGSS